jgi:hypothetical protein
MGVLYGGKLDLNFHFFRDFEGVDREEHGRAAEHVEMRRRVHAHVAPQQLLPQQGAHL